MVRRGLVESRTAAQEAIAAGLVSVDGGPALKPATQVHAGQSIALDEPPRRFVSRGGEKLDHGLDAFAVDPTGRICMDVGMSTGGFTDCLLQRGAAHVHGFDVGYGQVHERLRTDPRVSINERTNIRDASADDLPGDPPTLVVCDVSFIALKLVIPLLRRLAAPSAEAVVLVKPQFEADRAEVGKGGVVRDPAVWTRVLHEVASTGAQVGWRRFDAAASPLVGPAGNVEFLAHLAGGAPGDVDGAVAAAVRAGAERRER